MIKKIKKWINSFIYHPGDYMRGYEDGKRQGEEKFRGMNIYTQKQLENAYRLGHDDGKKVGLGVAREQAVKSLSEILKHQNK